MNVKSSPVEASAVSVGSIFEDARRSLLRARRKNICNIPSSPTKAKLRFSGVLPLADEKS
jgi:hypothetical protein